MSDENALPVGPEPDLEPVILTDLADVDQPDPIVARCPNCGCALSVDLSGRGETHGNRRDTELIAADMHLLNGADTRMRVLEVHAAFAEGGLTDEEAGNLLGRPDNHISPVTGRLVKAGCLDNTAERRMSKYQRPRMVRRVTALGLDVYQRWVERLELEGED